MKNGKSHTACFVHRGRVLRVRHVLPPCSGISPFTPLKAQCTTLLGYNLECTPATQHVLPSYSTIGSTPLSPHHTTP